MRLIDADVLYQKVKMARDAARECGAYEAAVFYDAFCEEVEQAKTVDAVEVVRCKDCKEEASERIGELIAEKSKAIEDLEDLMRHLPGQVCEICIKQGTEECNWGQRLYHGCTPKWRGPEDEY